MRSEDRLGIGNRRVVARGRRPNNVHEYDDTSVYFSGCAALHVGEVRPHKINKCNKFIEYTYYSIILQHIINAATNAAERFRYLTAR